MVAMTGDPASPVIIHSEERRDAAFTLSFDEEKEAMSMAVRWTMASSVDKVLICSDNQSLLCVIASGADSAVDIINLIQQIFTFSGCVRTLCYIQQ